MEPLAALVSGAALAAVLAAALAAVLAAVLAAALAPGGTCGTLHLRLDRSCCNS